MKKIYAKLLYLLSVILILSCTQSTVKFDLHSMVEKKELDVYNRDLSLINEDSYQGIKLSKAFGEGLAKLKNFEFSNGTIEFDVRGENVKMHSFVGLAFHGLNDSTFDAIYLRPFRFLEYDDNLRKHSIQYVSLPSYTWQKLREENPFNYESSISPSPNPDAWIKVKIVIKDLTVSTYINGKQSASLVVTKKTDVRSGFIALYVADTSGGDFANLVITKQD